LISVVDSALMLEYIKMMMLQHKPC